MRLPTRPVSGRRFRLTIRTRLALTYSAVLTASGVLMLSVLYVVLGLLPSYSFAVEEGVPSAPAITGVAPVHPLPSATQLPTATQLDSGVAANSLGVPSLLVSSRADLQRLFLIAAIVIVVLLIIAGAWLGWYLAGRMLRPLREIGKATTLAADGKLDHRLAFTGPEDEITELADSFDRMMGELEASFGAQRRFAANASHELRTPLATTRAMLDVALGATETATNTVLLERLRLMNERSISTVDALMDLSEVESGTEDRAEVRLDRALAQVLAEAAPEAESRDIEVNRNLMPTTIVEDSRFVHLLAVNLVHNALRHNVSAGEVWVSVGEDSPGVPMLRVENTGARLDPAALATLREPFFRVAGRARGTEDPGRGLGLSIVAAIAERCDATLDLQARTGGGLIATVRFRPDSPARVPNE
ncbi:sensor histidine kinase [Mycetocola lacteus]|uniref:histidine kinase n=1 Tax=Mycetocola lacteus TaxID=76637 RepID=A0A3L7ASF7_9MICO|nr:HAMP domain-containing sensor histidine kinase [Mycetocola lacteus]RLP82925.1 sensor histidine kinase [Mycetocola lacteus]